MDNAELAALALDIAREAGALARSGQAGVRIAGTKSSPIDLVTEMDQACEQLIRERLAASRPGDGFLGEESGEAVSDAASDCRWIVDPIDGTVNYVYGLPQWAVSIAAERQGVVVAGAVVAPALEEEYLGVLGQGSWRLAGGDRERLVCSQQTELAQALVATGFGYRRERRVEQGRVISALLPEIRDIRRCGAAAVDLCYVAAGRVDAGFERGLNPWDRAAGGLIATEAGARLGGLSGAPASEAMTLCAPPALYEALDRRLSALGATAPED